MKEDKNPHDSFFKKYMEQKNIAQELVLNYLPKDIIEVVDLNTLKQRSRELKPYSGSTFIADVVYEVKLKEQETSAMLHFEHESKVDTSISYRMLEYNCQLMGKSIQKKNKKLKLPLVYSTVVYHGKHNYYANTNIQELIDVPKSLINQCVSNTFQLLNLRDISSCVMKKQLYTGTMLIALKHIFSKKTEDLVEAFQMAEKLYYLGDKDLALYTGDYLYNNSCVKDEQINKKIQKCLTSEFGGKVMTLGQRVRAEGRREGMQQGMQQGILKGEKRGEVIGFKRARQEMAIKLIREFKDVNLAKKITGLSAQELMALQNDVL